MSSSAYLLLGGVGGGSRRPAPRPQTSLPPFDPPDESGTVHTSLPASVEAELASASPDPAFMLADFNGVVIPGEFTPPLTRNSDGTWNWEVIVAAGGVTMTTGRWTGLRIPFLQGANSTPPTMIMTTMLALYPLDVQIAALTEHAERNYPDFVSAAIPWNADANGRGNWSAGDTAAWLRYVQSWGFRNVLWRGGRPPDDGPDDALKEIFQSGAVGYYIHGKEVDQQGYARAEEYDDSCAKMIAYVHGAIPVGAHFSANGERHMSYPIGAPREFFLTNWAQFGGQLHLLLQMDVQASAGRQAAAMGYARRRVNLGQEGGQGPGAPTSRVIAFENMATLQLYGGCTEEYGCLRGLELMCDPETSGSPTVAGTGNGGRRHDGSSLRRVA